MLCIEFVTTEALDLNISLDFSVMVYCLCKSVIVTYKDIKISPVLVCNALPYSKASSILRNEEGPKPKPTVWNRFAFRNKCPNHRTIYAP